MVWCKSPETLAYQDIAEHTCVLQHCQRMAPEYSKAALSLHPLIPFYAVDCDVESNKGLCGGQVSALSCWSTIPSFNALLREYKGSQLSKYAVCDAYTEPRRVESVHGANQSHYLAISPRQPEASSFL
jgi:hypothetical protein